MRNVEDRSAFFLGDFLHAVDALVLEVDISDGEDFVHNHDLAFKVRSNRKAKLDVHSARITLDRRVYELPYLGELNDLIKLLCNLFLRHAEDRAVEINVLLAGKLAMKSRSDFEHGSDSSVEVDVTLCRSSNTADQLEQR